MKFTFIPGALALGLAATASAQTPAAAPVEATTPPIEVPAQPKLDPAVVKEDSSYALGFRTGSTFNQQFGRFGVAADDLDQQSFLKGFLAALKGGKPELEEEKLQAAMAALGDMLQTREKETAAANLEAGKKFLEENSKREGVITTASGLQYEIIEKGGDGKEFDASPEGEPVPMTLQVVDGFKEALTTMPVGAKWKLFLPSNLAYGEERRSADIGPNSVLIFELELEKIEDAPAQQGMPFPMPQGQ
jgi:FKBP-type peptidyl-prolyl cis-trans isomerase